MLKNQDVDSAIINFDLLLEEAKKLLPFKMRVDFLCVNNILLLMLSGVEDAILNEGYCS